MSRYGVAGLVLALGLPLLSACVTTEGGTRDSLGRTTVIGEPQEVTADKADLNVAALIDPRHVAKIERRIRDKELIIEKYSLTGVGTKGNGQIVVERVPDGWYSQGVVSDAGNAELFRERAEKLFQNSGYVSQTPAEKVQNGRARASVGYKTVATISQGNGFCFFSRVAYRLGMRTMYDNDWESPDTVMETVYCESTKANFAAFDNLMASVAMMTPADAAAIKAKLSQPGGRAAALNEKLAQLAELTRAAEERRQRDPVYQAQRACEEAMRNPAFDPIRYKVELFSTAIRVPPIGITSLDAYPTSEEGSAIKSWGQAYGACQDRLKQAAPATKPTDSEIAVFFPAFDETFQRRVANLTDALSESKMTFGEYATLRWSMSEDRRQVSQNFFSANRSTDAAQREKGRQGAQDKFRRTLSDWQAMVDKIAARSPSVASADADARSVMVSQ